MSPSGVYDGTGYGNDDNNDADGIYDQNVDEVAQHRKPFRAYYDARGQNHQGGGGGGGYSPADSSPPSRMTGYYDGSTGAGAGAEEEEDVDGVRYLPGASSSSTGGQQWAGDSRGGETDDMVASFSDDDVEELDGRSRYSGAMYARQEQQSRSKSLMRYSEIERERSRRRQHIVKQKAVKKFSPGTIKLSMMNAGIIPLKKGKEKKCILFLTTLGVVTKFITYLPSGERHNDQ